MKGYSHALSGAAAWTIVATPSVAVPLSSIRDKLPDVPISAGLLDVSPLTYALGLVLTSGAALLPDCDHHNGTIAHSLPKVGFIPSPTQALCAGVGKISGGHRHGTHSILGILIFMLIALLAGRAIFPINGEDYTIGAGVYAFLLTAFCLTVFKVGDKKAWFFRWVSSALIALAITVYFPNEWALLPIIVGLGAFAHCVGDSLTVGGVPWLYPFKPKTPKMLKGTVFAKFWQNNGWFAFPILGKTDSGTEKGPTREKTLCFVMSVYIFAGAVIAGLSYLSLLS